MASVSIFTDVKCIILSSSDVHLRPADESLGLSFKKGGPNGGRPAAVSSRFHPFHQELFICCRSHSQTLLEGLSQVTVGVLFTINSLQILFLDQNVNAFLGISFRKGGGCERGRNTNLFSERRQTTLTMDSPPP